MAIFAIGFAPLFGPPGYEHALLSGLIVPSIAAVAAALALSPKASALASEAAPPPVSQLLSGLGIGLSYALIAFASALVHGALTGFCGLGNASLYFALTAGIGAGLGGLWGAFVAEGARRARWRRTHAVFFGLAAPWLSIGIGVARFYGSPMVFAYDPFVGYFAGTLYDTVVDPGTALLTYRLGSLCTVAASFFAASLLVRRTDGGLVLSRVRRGDASRHFLVRAAVAAAFFGVSVAITWAGPALGHWETPATIARALGGKHSGPRCDVIHPDDMASDAALLLVRDCEEQLASVEAALGARGPARITAFFFRDAAEKKRLMGAADTYIAKPWRAEVYLQNAPYPHPVLAHELAHAVAGAFGVGPFHVAGHVGGLLPDPGLIEGIAVAAAPEKDALTDEEWSRAMLELNLLPSLPRVFSLGFLGESSAKSYTVAGAVVRWLMDSRGKDAVRALYQGQSTESVLGASWSELDAQFRAHLKTMPLESEVLAYAKARFDRPAIFGRTCPHEVDALVHEANACRDALRLERASVLYEAALQKSEHEMPARMGLALTRLRDGDLDAARRDLNAIRADGSAPQSARDHAEDALADADVRDGHFEAAARRYRETAARVIDDDFGRTLEVKALMAMDPLGRGSLEALLIGLPGRVPDAALGLTRLAAWHAVTDDPLVDYLLGRNLLTHEPRDALVALTRAVNSTLPTTRIRREAIRQLAISACIENDRAGQLLAKSAVDAELAERGEVASLGSSWSRSILRQLEACAAR